MGCKLALCSDANQRPTQAVSLMLNFMRRLSQSTGSIGLKIPALTPTIRQILYTNTRFLIISSQDFRYRAGSTCFSERNCCARGVEDNISIGRYDRVWRNDVAPESLCEDVGPNEEELPDEVDSSG